MRAFRGLIIFTLVEVVTLVVWLVLAGVPLAQHYLAIVVLGAGLLAEHYASINVGAGRSPFGPLPPDRTGGSF